MSADNWAICPGCVKEAHRAHRDLVLRAAEGYGRLSLAEFDALRAEADLGVNEEKFRTFREDYEIYLDEDAVMVSYSGHCQKCSAGTDFRYEHAVEGLA